MRFNSVIVLVTGIFILTTNFIRCTNEKHQSQYRQDTIQSNYFIKKADSIFHEAFQTAVTGSNSTYQISYDSILLMNSLKYIDSAIIFDTLNEKAYYRQGILFRELNQFNKAIFSFSKSIVADSTFAEAYFERGALLNEMGNEKKSTDGCSDILKAAQLGYGLAKVSLIKSFPHCKL